MRRYPELVKTGLIFFFIVFLAVEADSASIEFDHSSRHYSIEKSKSDFVLRLPHLEKRAKITKCSEKIFGEFWKRTDARVKALQLTSKGSRIPAAANLKIDGIKRQVLEFEPSFEFFFFLHQDAMLAIAEAERKCTK